MKATLSPFFTFSLKSGIRTLSRFGGYAPSDFISLLVLLKDIAKGQLNIELSLSVSSIGSSSFIAAGFKWLTLMVSSPFRLILQ